MSPLAKYVSSLPPEEREALVAALPVGGHGRCVYSTRTAEERALAGLRRYQGSMIDRVASLASDELAALREVLQ